MRTVTVRASKTYDVIIGSNILNQYSGGYAAVITDNNVAVLYGDRFPCKKITLTPGESSKNIETLGAVLNNMAEFGITRADSIAALGGGVVGDVAGFAAACYMRGIKYTQFPTTLLAMVDSSVGGKTGIDLEAGKNLAGAFWQPEAVICDVSLLETLSEAVFRDGCAEIVKYGMIADRELLSLSIRENLEDVIARCVEIKRDIVAKDEYDRGDRMTLNFGHTVGHAIEVLTRYSTTHGNAVAIGMAVITRAAVKMGLCDTSCLQALLDSLSRYGLPDNTHFETSALVNACLADKKRSGEKITLVFPAEPGKCLLKQVTVSELKAIFKMGLEA
jgi:3-dehydroquinate synthase